MRARGSETAGRTLAALSLLLSACAASVADGELLPRELPADAAPRDAVLDRFGARLYAALGRGALATVLASTTEYDGAVRRSQDAVGPFGGGGAPDVSPEDRALWRAGRYAGVCAQSGRLEIKGGVLGLRENGFVVERLLVVGREPSGARLAGWVEGVFVLTGRGFVALSIARVESPRRDHSDLELAECELWASPSEAQHMVAGGETVY